jgi:hypothetical protein
MRLAALTLIGALGLAAATVSAQAAPAAPNLDKHSSNIVQVWGGCGPGWRPVPGHWSHWRGWVPPHCAPSRRFYYGGGYYPYWRHHGWYGY